MPTDANVARVFRESFVVLFEQPEHQAALRVVDDVARSIAIEGRDAIEDRSGTFGASLQREMPGVIGDLRQAIESLDSLGSWIDQAELDRAESRLSLTAGDTAAELEPFAARLDKALARYLGSTTSSK
jgi:hypothetical protein